MVYCVSAIWIFRRTIQIDFRRINTTAISVCTDKAGTVDTSWVESNIQVGIGNLSTVRSQMWTVEAHCTMFQGGRWYRWCQVSWLLEGVAKLLGNASCWEPRLEYGDCWTDRMALASNSMWTNPFAWECYFLSLNRVGHFAKQASEMYLCQVKGIKIKNLWWVAFAFKLVVSWSDRLLCAGFQWMQV